MSVSRLARIVRSLEGQRETVALSGGLMLRMEQVAGLVVLHCGRAGVQPLCTIRVTAFNAGVTMVASLSQHWNITS